MGTADRPPVGTRGGGGEKFKQMQSERHTVGGKGGGKNVCLLTFSLLELRSSALLRGDGEGGSNQGRGIACRNCVRASEIESGKLLFNLSLGESGIRQRFVKEEKRESRKAEGDDKGRLPGTAFVSLPSFSF